MIPRYGILALIGCLAIVQQIHSLMDVTVLLGLARLTAEGGVS